jgi:ArsR family transcriptional regulator
MPLKQCCQLKGKKEKLTQTKEFLRVISDENRLNILCALKKEEQCVGSIWQYLDLPQNLVSHHLKVLKEFGLLNSRKDGKNVVYSLNAECLESYKSLLINFI